MTEEEAQRVMLSGFMWMDRAQRKAVIKVLRHMREKLDMDYPLGYRPDEKKD